MLFRSTAHEVTQAFEVASAAVAPVYNAADILNDPQVQALDMVTTVSDADLGPLRMNNVLFRMSETPGSIRYTGRSLGADTDAVLEEAGIERAHIKRLRTQGVLR